MADAARISEAMRSLNVLSAVLLWGGCTAPLLLSAAAAGDQPPGPVRTVDQVDLNRYLGDWVEIARFPNWCQRTCTGDVRASYASRTSAKLKVRVAPVVLSLLPFVWGDYWVLGLADDYSWAVVGSPGRDDLWILAREPMLDAAQFISAKGGARANEFDVERLIKTSHAAMPPVSRDGTP